MKVCVIAKLSLSESKQEFLYSIFWVMHASIGHLGCMNVLPYESVIIFWSYEYEIRSS